MTVRDVLKWTLRIVDCSICRIVDSLNGLGVNLGLNNFQRKLSAASSEQMKREFISLDIQYKRVVAMAKEVAVHHVCFLV